MSETATPVTSGHDDDVREIMKVLEQLCDRIAENDVEGVMGLFAKSDDVVMYGSEQLAVARGPEELRTLWTELLGRGTRYEWEWDATLIRIREGVAWLSSQSSVRIIDRVTIRRGYRLTLVMCLEDGRWVIEHFHGSEPVAAWA